MSMYLGVQVILGPSCCAVEIVLNRDKAFPFQMLLCMPMYYTLRDGFVDNEIRGLDGLVPIHDELVGFHQTIRLGKDLNGR